ncbi:hypothetical protein T069G_09129 [Trichoderma breve]|uniref:Uncharacterized protein n=1 Tax=Trichoderma breve TaxID=2034170 RepID=A0A9W9BA06_9HYPO|nr:hypothetical protein T069G_09129 [Trichoderma breve]KAJ4855761.1 hypothetical protein T069G_09129 [Trichoderma breve]
MEQPTVSPEEAAKSQFINNQFHDETRIHQRHNNTTLNLHLTHRPARAAIRLTPYPRNEDLIHHPDLVDKLNTLLPYPSAISHSAALWGLGGSGLNMGKSSIINEKNIILGHVSGKETEMQVSRHTQPIESTGMSNDEHLDGEKYFSSIAPQAAADLFPDSQRDTWKQCGKFLARVLQIGEWADVNKKQIETTQLLEEQLSCFIMVGNGEQKSVWIKEYWNSGKEG